jgi:hypothetical protein
MDSIPEANCNKDTKTEYSPAQEPMYFISLIIYPIPEHSLLVLVQREVDDWGGCQIAFMLRHDPPHHNNLATIAFGEQILELYVGNARL